MSIKTGGSAFPVIDYTFEDEDGMRQYKTFYGMTLRDYFAAKAMQQLIAEDGNCARVAKDAYAFADAMMAERDVPA